MVVRVCVLVCGVVHQRKQEMKIHVGFFSSGFSVLNVPVPSQFRPVHHSLDPSVINVPPCSVLFRPVPYQVLVHFNPYKPLQQK